MVKEVEQWKPKCGGFCEAELQKIIGKGYIIQNSNDNYNVYKKKRFFRVEYIATVIHTPKNNGATEALWIAIQKEDDKLLNHLRDYAKRWEEKFGLEAVIFKNY